MAILTNAFAVAVASFAVAWAGLAFTSGAHAEDTSGAFKVAISYKKSDPAPVTYARIKEQAALACRRQSNASPLTPASVRQAEIKRCKEDVVAKAVTAIGKPDLLAFHKGERAPGTQVATR